MRTVSDFNHGVNVLTGGAGPVGLALACYLRLGFSLRLRCADRHRVLKIAKPSCRLFRSQVMVIGTPVIDDVTSTHWPLILTTSVPATLLVHEGRERRAFRGERSRSDSAYIRVLPGAGRLTNQLDMVATPARPKPVTS